MPNYCNYTMKIKGMKEKCDRWLDKLRDYDEDNHFWRIFESEVYDEGGTENDYYMCISGYCAWSLESCCRSGYTEEDLFEKNTRQFGLVMEAWSEEPGIGFQEHYIYNKGDCIKDECVDAAFWSSYLL